MLNPLTNRGCFAIRVEERHVDLAGRRRPNVELDDTDAGSVRPKERAKPLEHDLVVVDQGDTNFGHPTWMLPSRTERNTRSGD